MSRRKYAPPFPEPDRREETVIHGYHPELESIHSMGYDNRDPYLEAHPKREDLRYVGPQERLRRHKTYRYD